MARQKIKKIIYTAGALKEPFASPAQGVAKANPSRFWRGERGKPWVNYNLLHKQICAGLRISELDVENDLDQNLTQQPPL